MDIVIVGVRGGSGGGNSGGREGGGGYSGSGGAGGCVFGGGGAGAGYRGCSVGVVRDFRVATFGDNGGYVVGLEFVRDLVERGVGG